MKSSRPHIAIKDDRLKECRLIDMRVSTDIKRSVKEYNKLSTQKDREI